MFFFVLLFSCLSSLLSFPLPPPSSFSKKMEKQTGWVVVIHSFDPFVDPLPPPYELVDGPEMGGVGEEKDFVLVSLKDSIDERFFFFFLFFLFFFLSFFFFSFLFFQHPHLPPTTSPTKTRKKRKKRHRITSM